MYQLLNDIELCTSTLNLKTSKINYNFMLFNDNLMLNYECDIICSTSCFYMNSFS